MAVSSDDLGQAVFVRFDFGGDFDRARVMNVAHESRSLFEGMPGLRQKVFTLDEASRSATNFYLWDSTDHAEAFFTPQVVERVTGLYGVSPTITYADVAEIVRNT